MGSLHWKASIERIFGSNQEPKYADILRDSPPHPRLPRQVRHSISREHKVTFEESFQTETGVLKELRQMADKSKISLEALVSGSREEMKKGYAEISQLRGLLKKLELSYLYHYYRVEHGSRLLAKVQKLKPYNGKTTKVLKPKPEEEIKAKLAKMPEEKKKEAERLLKEMGILK